MGKNHASQYANFGSLRIDQEYTAVHFLTTKCRVLHMCSMKLGTYMFHLTFV